MRKRRARRTWLWAAVPFAVLLLVGCNGGDGGGDDTDTADTTATTEPSTTEPPPPTVFTRQEINTLSAEQLSRYKAGVALMQSRAATEVTSWLYQANMHDYPRPGDTTCPATPFSGPNPPEAWGTCQHASFFFLSWHRMYVDYSQRIPRAAVREARCHLDGRLRAAATWTTTHGQPRPAGAVPQPGRRLEPALRLGAGVELQQRRRRQPGASRTASGLDDDAMDETQHKNFCGCRNGQPAPPAAINNTFSDETFGGNFTATLEQLPERHRRAANSSPTARCYLAVGGSGPDQLPASPRAIPILLVYHADVDRLWQVWLNLGAWLATPPTTNGGTRSSLSSTRPRRRSP